jgi:hypothetical protein
MTAPYVHPHPVALDAGVKFSAANDQLSIHPDECWRLGQGIPLDCRPVLAENPRDALVRPRCAGGRRRPGPPFSAPLPTGRVHKTKVPRPPRCSGTNAARFLCLILYLTHRSSSVAMGLSRGGDMLLTARKHTMTDDDERGPRTDLGSRGRKPVGVRLPPLAPGNKST